MLRQKRLLCALALASLANVWSDTFAQPLAQFPSTQPGVGQPGATAFGAAPAPSTFAAPGTPSTYAAPGSVAAPGTITAPGTVSPPPTFDPYATGGIGPPPATVPYNYAQPAPAAAVNPWQANPQGTVAPTYPQQNSVFPSGTAWPFDWQQGSYSYEGQNGYLVQAQKFLQELSVEHTWLYGNHDAEDFEIHRPEIYSTFAFPTPYFVNTPLLVTPGFAANFFEGPNGSIAAMPPGPELPPRVYDAYLDVAWYPQVTQVIGAELGVRSGVWTDFDHLDSDSVRLLGRGLAKVSLSPQLDVLFGAVYLDRLRVKLLPAGGVYWRPDPNWDLYLVFPNPKARRHFTSLGTTEWFWYLAGEYGGGSWSVDRSGTPGRFDYNDIRVSVGFEFETLTQMRGHIEAGYVFDREVIFADSSMTPTFKPDDTFMLRGGVDF